VLSIRLKHYLTGISLLIFSHIASGDELANAASKGDWETLFSLLQDGVNVNEPAPDGTVALSHAAYRNELKIVEFLLLTAEAEVNIANDFGATPLYIAATNADAIVVERLLNAGADPNASLLSGETPLMGASNRGRHEIARLLLENGADPNINELVGEQTALMWAAAEKHVEVVRLLVNYKADINARSNREFSPLMFAIREGDGNLEIVNILLEAGANVNDLVLRTGLTPLMMASIGGFEKIAQLLLKHGANPSYVDRNGMSILHHAVDNHETSSIIVEALLLRGADPNSRIFNPNNQLYKPGDRSPAVESPQGATPLVLAARKNNLDAIITLLAAGADPFIPTEQNTTVLHMAAGAGTDFASSTPSEQVIIATKIVRLLVELGADVNSVGEFGWTPLHSAAYHGRNDIIKVLIENGANLNAMDELGQTPLSISYAVVTPAGNYAYYQSPRTFRRSTVDLLLSLGATPLEESGVEILALRSNE